MFLKANHFNLATKVVANQNSSQIPSYLRHEITNIVAKFLSIIQLRFVF